MKRQIVLDTETTGLKPDDGHRIVEIGAVELIDGVRTGRTFHSYVNPERHIPEEVVKIHQIDDEKVKDAPKFKEVVSDFIDFIKDSELLIHNADFDIKFLNSELNIVNRGNIWDHVKNAICTLKMSKSLYAEERSHSLDSICKRFGISLDEREEKGHGALLDCELLAECYLKIISQYSTEEIEADLEQTNWVRPPINRYSGLKFKTVKLTEQEEINHKEFLNKNVKTEKISPIFLSSVNRPTI